MNAIDFLIKEHNQVRETLTQISNISSATKTREKLFHSLCTNLIRHEAMEHAIWYPCFRNNSQLNSAVRHLLSEEKHAERAIEHLKSIEQSQEWEKKFSQLKAEVEKHAQEEEQLFFPEARKLLSQDELEQIGLDMLHFKQDYEGSLN
jgi:iron-sulfur cluster repair protein YtfE (RIC family)